MDYLDSAIIVQTSEDSRPKVKEVTMRQPRRLVPFSKFIAIE